MPKSIVQILFNSKIQGREIEGNGRKKEEERERAREGSRRKISPP